MRPRFFSALTVLLLVAPALLTAQEEPTVVYLVRHAERADDEEGFDMSDATDPALSAAGWERSYLLARMLRDAGLTRIHSTDLRRTRSTGQPTAEVAGLEIEVYDPRDLAGFANRLRSSRGRHLVLGHRDTTPELVEALGGEAGPPIEPMEYDRLYILTIGTDAVSTVLIRFGNRFQS